MLVDAERQDNCLRIKQENRTERKFLIYVLRSSSTTPFHWALSLLFAEVAGYGLLVLL